MGRYSVLAEEKLSVLYLIEKTLNLQLTSIVLHKRLAGGLKEFLWLSFGGRDSNIKVFFFLMAMAVNKIIA